MAEDKLRRGTILRVKLSDGETVPTFNVVCGLNTRSFNQSKNMNDFAATNCTNPDAVKPLRRIVVSTGVEVSGGGWFLTENREDLQAVYDNPVGADLRLEVNVPLAEGGGYYQGRFHMSQFNVTGADDEMSTAEFTFVSDGAVPWVDASA